MYIIPFKKFVLEKNAEEYKELISNNKQALEEKDVETIENLSNELKVYNQRKNSLKRLILNNINSDKDISKNINDIVEDNTMLQKYLLMLNIDKQFQEKEQLIENKKQEYKDLQRDLIEVKKIENENDKKIQSDKIKSRMRNIEEDVKVINDDIDNLRDEYSEKEKEMKEYINNKEEKLKELEREIKQKS